MHSKRFERKGCSAQVELYNKEEVKEKVSNICSFLHQRIQN